jgi:hypothetical protein
MTILSSHLVTAGLAYGKVFMARTAVQRLKQAHPAARICLHMVTVNGWSRPVVFTASSRGKLTYGFRVREEIQGWDVSWLRSGGHIS